MKLSVRLAISAALLTAAAVPAQAQVAVPTPPALFPTDGSIGATGANPSPGNGGLLVQAFDPLNGLSLTEYVGINYNNFLPTNAVTAAGGTTDFGIIGGSALWNATFGSDTNPIDFSVVSANSATSGSNSILSTVSVGTTAAVRNNAVTSAAGKFNATVGGLTAGQAANSLQDPGVNPAQTLATTDNGYLAVTNLGANIGGVFLSTTGVAGGSAVGFYKFTQSSTNALSQATVTQYGNATGVATFSMDANGDLKFIVPTSGTAPVPLPAAIWLLGSGLLGFAGIGRRRAAAKA